MAETLRIINQAPVSEECHPPVIDGQTLDFVRSGEIDPIEQYAIESVGTNRLVKPIVIKLKDESSSD